MRRAFGAAWMFTALAMGVAAGGQPARFDGHSVVRVDVRDEAQLAEVESLTDDVWSHHVGVGPLDIRVDPVQRAALDARGLRYTVLIEDVQAVIDAQDQARAARSGPVGPFDDYLPLAGVVAHLDGLAAARPDLVTRLSIGQSIEGRELEAVRITGPGDASNRPAVVFVGGIHAREWIAVAVPLYAADRLVADYDTDGEVRRLVDAAVLYFIPVLNPDGYEYTWTTFRLWRKNRRGDGVFTWGVDLNRNFGHFWGGPGSSPDIFSEIYRGESAFSEPEAAALRDFVSSLPNVAGYCDFHNFSQLLHWPWAYAPILAPDHFHFDLLARDMLRRQRAISNTVYVPNSIAIGLTSSAGSTKDWFYAEHDIFALGFELPDTGQFGFLLPPDRILPVSDVFFPTLLEYTAQTAAPIKLSVRGMPPVAAPPGVPVDLVVHAESIDDAAPVAGVELRSRRVGEADFTVSSLAPAADADAFTGALDSLPCGGAIEYFIRATRSDGISWTLPRTAPDALYRIDAARGDVIFEDDFETARGWSFMGSLPPGRWIRGTPSPTFVNGVPAEPDGGNPFGSGGQCYVTQPSTSSDPEASDVDGGPTYLLSPQFDITGVADPIVSYYRWLFSTSVVPLKVEVSENFGSWQEVFRTQTTEPWQYEEFRVRDYLPSADRFYIRFGIYDPFTTTSITEAAIDDFILFEGGCIPGLIGDLNCDGALTVSDIAPFVLALTDPAGYLQQFPECDILNADTSNDGRITVSDIAGLVVLLSR